MDSRVLKTLPLFLFSLFLAAAFAGGLCVALAKFMCQKDLNPALLVPITTVLCCMSVLLASMLLALLNKGGLLSGMALALVFFLGISAISVYGTQSSFTSLWATKGLAFLAAGALGGYLGAWILERRKKIRR